MKPKIVMPENPTPEMRKAIVDPLISFNRAQVGSFEYQALAILIQHPQTDEILGGLWGGSQLAQLHIDLLFIPESMRGDGLGREILTQAEAEAIKRACRVCWLDTYSFQARGFYERLGYRVFGTLENCPPGHARYWLKKTLPADSAT